MVHEILTLQGVKSAANAFLTIREDLQASRQFGAIDLLDLLMTLALVDVGTGANSCVDSVDEADRFVWRDGRKVEGSVARGKPPASIRPRPERWSDRDQKRKE